MQTRYTSFRNLFRAAGSDIRLSILHMLAREPMSVGAIVRRLKRSPPLTAHHLNILLKAGWVTKTKFGRLVTYYLNEKTLQQIKKGNFF